MIPQRIGKYEVRAKLGDGATSAVYLAYDRFAQRQVAIKLIHRHVLQDEERGRLYRHLLNNEASLAGKLAHPHIVQIFDAVISDEEGYLAMEFVPGGTLEQYCTTDFLLPIDRLVEIAFKCTRALDYAYRQGVTHRDIKPANILMGDGSNIKVSDFGAALFTANDRTQISGVGSPAYMSPQQVREQPLNHQTDIFSLGVVMYQVLTGRLPFQATNNYSMVFQVCNFDPPAPSSIRSDVPPAIDAVVARAMQKSLELRYQTWDEFAHDLAQAFRNRQLSVVQHRFSDSEKFEALRDLSFFDDFSDVEIWEVVRFSQWENVTTNTYVMRDGEPGDYLCFLIEGEVRVVKRGKVRSVLSPGECFGEMAVIGRVGGSRNANVVATAPSKIVIIRGESVKHASDACRMHLYSAFLHVLTERLALANARICAA